MQWIENGGNLRGLQYSESNDLSSKLPGILTKLPKRCVGQKGAKLEKGTAQTVILHHRVWTPPSPPNSDQHPGSCPQRKRFLHPIRFKAVKQSISSVSENGTTREERKQNELAGKGRKAEEREN